MIEALDGDLWTDPGNTLTLARHLSSSDFHPAIQRRLLSLRLMNQRFIPGKSCVNENHSQIHRQEPEFNIAASHCRADMADEVESLRALEHRALATVRSMLGRMSGDVAMCSEEVDAALDRARRIFAPAQTALSRAVCRLAADQEASTLAARYARHTSFSPDASSSSRCG